MGYSEKQEIASLNKMFHVKHIMLCVAEKFHVKHVNNIQQKRNNALGIIINRIPFGNKL